MTKLSMVAALLLGSAGAQTYALGNYATATLARAATVANQGTGTAAYLNTLTYAAGVATTATQYGVGLGLSVGQTLVIAGTGTCQDGNHTIASVVDAVFASYTYATACTATWTESYDTVPAMAKIGSTLVEVHAHHGNNTNEDVAEGDLQYRTSTDGLTWTAQATAVDNTGNVLCAPGATCDAANPVCGPTGDSKVVCLYALHQNTPSGAWKGTYRIIWNGSTWGAPSQVTAVDSGVPTDELITGSGQIAAMPGGCIGAALVRSANDVTYLYTSCDHGVTWGTGGGTLTKIADAGGTAISLPTNETTIAWISGTRYLGFSRGCDASAAPPACKLYVLTSADGIIWTRSTSDFAFTGYNGVLNQNQISPVLIPSYTSNWTLCYGERMSTGTYRGAIKCITFAPATAYASPTGFGRTQAPWVATSSFPLVGYPAMEMVNSGTMALVWMSGIYPASLAHLYNLTGDFAAFSATLGKGTWTGWTVQ